MNEDYTVDPIVSLLIQRKKEKQRSGLVLSEAAVLQAWEHGSDQRFIPQKTRARNPFVSAEQMKLLRPNAEEAERRELEFLGLRLPYEVNAVNSPNAVSNTTTEVPAPLGITLPIGVVTDHVSALSEEEIILDDNSAEELLDHEAQLYEAFALLNCVIESREYHMEHIGGVYTLYATYTCVEDIAYTEPIGTDENTDLTPYVAPTENHHL